MGGLVVDNGEHARYVTLCPGGCGMKIEGFKHPNVQAQRFIQCRDCNIEGWRHESKFEVYSGGSGQ